MGLHGVLGDRGGRLGDAMGPLGLLMIHEVIYIIIAGGRTGPQEDVKEVQKTEKTFYHTEPEESTPPPSTWM